MDTQPAHTHHMQRTQPVIVHVDDREVNRYTVRKYLESAGYQIEQADNGGKGLQLVKAVHPDLVILEVKLPDMTGFALCQRIKADPSTAAIPVMHISAHFIDTDDRAEGLNSGSDAYLTSISKNELNPAFVFSETRPRV